MVEIIGSEDFATEIESTDEVDIYIINPTKVINFKLYSVGFILYIIFIFHSLFSNYFL